MRVQRLGLVPYLDCYERMRTWTEQRTETCADELWMCEHPAVFTQGLAGLPSHLLNPEHIPVVQSNRGGQVTHHGPGQVVAYPLINLKRCGYFVKEYVYRLEESVLRTLSYWSVVGHRVAGAPGIYVRMDNPFDHARLAPAPDGASFAGLGKIAALGIKVSRHCTYHGAALNVCMDLSPFGRINPCGYAQLQTVDLSTIGVGCTTAQVQEAWIQELVRLLSN